MSEWYYRSGGRESESCTFDAILELVAAGRLKREDELRQRADGEWMAAASVVGLFPDPQELSDLSELDFTFEESADAETRSQRPAQNEPATDETDFELQPAAAPVESIPAEAPAAVAEQPASDAWYYRSLGLELGPMPLAELIQMTVDGTISADDSVRSGAAGAWRSASTVDVLAPILDVASRASAVPSPEPRDHPAPLTPAIEEETPSSIETLRDAGTEVEDDIGDIDDVEEGVDVEDLRDDEPDEPPPNETMVGDEAASAGPVAESIGSDRWFCRIDGVEHGPLSYKELSAMAQHGRIDRGNQVRSGEDGAWLPAASIGGLFAGSAPSSARGAGAGMPYAPPKPIVSTPKRTRAPRDPLMPKIKEQFVSNWKVLSGVAGLMFAAGLIALFSSGVFRKPDAEYLNMLQAIYDKHKALKKRKANPDEWAPLVAEAEELKARIGPALESTARANNPVRQELFWATKYELVPMLQRYAAGDKDKPRDDSIDHEKEFATHLKNARKLLNGESIADVLADEDDDIEE
ncbi:MAG: GYF domain-containing protein [Planctomycetaceae bacterium]